MNQQVSPFAALTGAEKQIRWLEYQSICLPYVQAQLDEQPEKREPEKPKAPPPKQERPQPPPEVSRLMPDYQRTRHSQYDAVIARMKQAELQSRRNQSLQMPQQG